MAYSCGDHSTVSLAASHCQLPILPIRCASSSSRLDWVSPA